MSALHWSATGMPRWRNAMIESIGLITHRSDFDPPAYQTRIRAAELYWVTKDMTAAVYDASTDMPPWTPAIETPAPIGLILYAGDLPAISVSDATRLHQAYRDHPPQLRGFFWAQYGGQLHIETLATTADLDRISRASGLRRPALPDEAVFPVSTIPPVDVTEIFDLPSRDKARWMIQLLGATWVLMMQPTVATPRQQIGAGTSARAYRDLTREVTIIDLRPMKNVHEEEDPDHPGRVYTHRWIVRGHWRDQAHGPNRSLRKRIWVPSYTKGPDGAPLLARERVNVWRR